MRFHALRCASAIPTCFKPMQTLSFRAHVVLHSSFPMSQSRRGEQWSSWSSTGSARIAARPS
eukprot:scaffold48550_cov68-Phaeocystis_antarctica.AAC.12